MRSHLSAQTLSYVASHVSKITTVSARSLEVENVPTSVRSTNSSFNILPPGGQESSVLRHAELPIWKQKDCDNAYFQPIRDIFICAGFADGGKDACQVGSSISKTGGQ